MGGFKDLRDFVDRRFLDLPIGGTTYRVWDVDGETGLWANRMVELGRAVERGDDVEGADLSDDQEQDMYRRMLGDTINEMLNDGVDWADIKLAGITVMAWVVHDEETALKVWEGGGSPEGMPSAPQPGAKPNRASRRASAAVAKKTPRRASTSGTRATKTRATPGEKSSNSGDS